MSFKITHWRKLRNLFSENIIDESKWNLKVSSISRFGPLKIWKCGRRSTARQMDVDSPSVETRSLRPDLNYKKAFDVWVNFWTKSSDKISCNLVSMITRLVSLAFAIIALILLLRKQFHALDIFSDLTKIYGLFNVSFLPFFKRVLLKALWKVCFDFERTGRIFDFDKTFLCFQNYQIWPFLWRNQLSLLRHRYFYPMGMPLREVESQTHYTGNDLINYSFVAAYVGPTSLVQFWRTLSEKIHQIWKIFSEFHSSIKMDHFRKESLHGILLSQPHFLVLLFLQQVLYFQPRFENYFVDPWSQMKCYPNVFSYAVQKIGHLKNEPLSDFI